MTFSAVIEKTVSLDYLFYTPEGYEDPRETWPLVIFLHGAGERGDDLEKVKAHGPPKHVANGKTYPFILVAPQCPRDEYWDIDALQALLQSIKAEHRVDADRIYLTGLSMGGYGTWRWGGTHPEEFAALLPICGGGRESDAERLATVPVWAFHGDEDEAVRLKESRKMVDAVNAAGGDAGLTVYPGVGHDSWTRTYANPEVVEWMLAQRRGMRETVPRPTTP
jgi:predicted peptidase